MYPKVSPCNPITATCDHVPALPPQSFYSCICLFVGSLINSCKVFTTPRWIQSQTLHYSNSQLFILFLLLLSHLSVSTFSTPILLSLTHIHTHTKAITTDHPNSLSRLLRKQPTGFVLFFTFLLLLFWFSLAAGGTCARHVARSERSLVSSHEGHHRTFLGSNCEDGRVWRFFESAVNSGGKCGGGPPSIGARFGGGSLIGSGCFSARSPLLVWFCSSCSTITARIGSNSPFW